MNSAHPRDLQFSLRTLLVGMLVVSLLAALLGPLARQAHTRYLAVVGTMAFAFLSMAAATLIGMAGLRGRAYRHAGKRLWSSRGWGLPVRLGFLTVQLFIIVPLVGGLAIFCLAQAIEIGGSSYLAGVGASLIMMLGSAALACASIAVLMFSWWGTDCTHVCENGLQIGWSSIEPWTNFDRWYWRRDDRLTAVVEGERKGYELVARAENREELAELLNGLIVFPAEVWTAR